MPDLTIVLNHLGGLTRIGPYANRDDEVLATWRRGIAALAECRNVNLKLGGIGMPRMGFDWHTREKPIGSEELAASMAIPQMPLPLRQGLAGSGGWRLRYCPTVGNPESVER